MVEKRRAGHVRGKLGFFLVNSEFPSKCARSGVELPTYGDYYVLIDYFDASCVRRELCMSLVVRVIRICYVPQHTKYIGVKFRSLCNV